MFGEINIRDGFKDTTFEAETKLDVTRHEVETRALFIYK